MGDRISNLPNDVICHILSFLPTKDAVATSNLSKQWKLQWRSVPVFDFECHCQPSGIQRKKGVNHKLLDSINAYLNSRDPLQSFKRFRLGSFPFEFHTKICYPTNVTQLISTVVVQHRLEQLDVSLPFKLDLPSVVLSSKTLVVLKLRSSTLRSFSSIDLPLLKIMHLKSVFLSEYKLLADLVSGCPNLEEIEVHHVRIHNYNLGVKPNFKKMHKLVRAVVDYYVFPLQVLSNVRFLRIDSMDSTPGCAIKFPIAQFHNLTHIEFGFEEYIYSELDNILVLNDCPKLQCLFIDQKTDDEFDDEEPDESDESSWRKCPLRLPTCISQLESFYINNYKDRLMEFEFSKYIMQNARLLKRMYVHTSRGTSEQKKLQIREKLSVFSSTCKLLVN